MVKLRHLYLGGELVHSSYMEIKLHSWAAKKSAENNSVTWGTMGKCWVCS